MAECNGNQLSSGNAGPLCGIAGGAAVVSTLKWLEPLGIKGFSGAVSGILRNR